MEEIWKPVVGFEGLYDVSSIGRVRRSGGGQGARSGHVRRLFPDPNGYYRVMLYRGGRYAQRTVHRLVAEAFHGPRPTGYVAHHADENKQNNRSENLSWVTRRQNLPTGHRPPIKRGSEHVASKLCDDDVRAIRGLAGTMRQTDIAQQFGVHQTLISLIIHRKTWVHVQ